MSDYGQGRPGWPAAATTTTVRHLFPTPPPLHLPWAHWWVFALAVPPMIVLIVANRRLNAQKVVTGGAGQVVGIVGRMGSGKSYMAVRMALRRLKHGANIVTNFSMHIEQAPAVNDLRKQFSRREVARLLDMPKKKVKVLEGISGTWRAFQGWDQFAELENCVVIVDEAHLYAPSNKTLVFPDVARYKMSMARKFRVDVYWLTQHENRVNTVLKDSTNMMYVCRSWCSALLFTVTGYEPEKMRRKNQHLERLAYRFNIHVAQLYDTLEILSPDDHLMTGSASMEKAVAVAQNYNQRRAHRAKGGSRVG